MGRLLDPLPGRLRTMLVYAIAFLIFAAAGYVLFRVLATVASLALAVAAALLLAALLAPLVDLLIRVRVPRGLAAFLVVLALVAVLGFIGTLFTVGFARELDSLRSDIAGAIEDFRQWLVTGPLPVDEAQVDRITAEVSDQLRRIGPQLTRGAANVIEAVALVLLTLVLLFFLLRDGRAMTRWLLGGLREHHRECGERAALAGWRALQSYVRGSAIIAAVDAAGIGIGLVILGVPLAVPLTLITFVASFVPLVGATVAGALAVLVALATKGPLTAVLVLVVVLLVQNLEGNLLEPLVLGRAVRLHPAVILLAVAAGALVAGVGGALLATPLTAMTHRVIGVLRDCPGQPPSAGAPDVADRPPPTDA
ncbi:MAG: AI-2E family transporter [Micromonosporaceae bacterium]|nr:AI-2E family transporter [Micromonosporaceae bacterium]